MSYSLKTYYKYHLYEKLDFRYRLYLLNKEMNLENKVSQSQNLIYKVTNLGIGVYSCEDLEKPYIELAQTIPTLRNQKVTPNSFLHVLTRAYTTGGHTRVAERWIETAPVDEKHSIVLLNQRSEPYPPKLENITCSHQGELYLFEENNLLDKAKRLRDLACSYEYVILHIHMDDPTALVAFGTEEFTRPVILFNHADHSYWCGASIVDMLADLRVNDFAQKYRGINNVHPIRIPFDANKSIQEFATSKEESRKILGIPLDKKIILTVGGAHKFSPFAGYEFCELVSRTIKSMDNVVCYGVGPTSETGNWGKFGDKFVAVGEINYGEEYFHYLNACDVYVNSIPIGGGTAMLDAVQFHKPVVSYSLFNTKLGNIINGIETTHDLKAFDHTLKLILQCDDAAKALAVCQYEGVLECHGIENWRNNIEVMLSKTPKKHSIHDISKAKYKINDLAIMISLWCGTLSNRKLTVYDIYHCIKRWLHL